MSRENGISGSNALKLENTGWEVLEGGGEEKKTTWNDLIEMGNYKPPRAVSRSGEDTVDDGLEGAWTVGWLDYSELEKLESLGVKSYKIFMRPPPIEKTTGLTDGEWKKVAARFDNEAEWHPERVKFHESIVQAMLQGADRLSQRLREHEIAEGRKPTIYCLRGTCGSGKTTALREGLFEGVLDEDGQPSGTLAPDTLKTPLRENGRMSHVQVHDESSMLSRKVLAKIKERARRGPFSMVYDKLMGYRSDFVDVFEDADETDREVAILDIDVPLELSAVRVLTREKNGEDPNIDFAGVASAFAAIRGNRSALFGQIAENANLVGSYTLRVFNPETKRSVEVARFEDGRIRTIPGREALAKQAVMTSSAEIESEIASIRDTVITEDYIAHFEENYANEESWHHVAKNLVVLRANLGKTLGEALDNKAS